MLPAPPRASTRSNLASLATRTRWVFAVAALVLSACQPNRFVSVWAPYWNSASGRATIADSGAASLFSEVSPFWYAATADGSVTTTGGASNLAATVDAARGQGLPVIPSVVDGTAPGQMSAILDNPVTRAAHVQNIVDLVMSKGYDGIDLDYEVFAFRVPKDQWPAITPDWVAFIDSLANALHSRGKLLSVTVPPVWISGGVTRGYTVYAQAQIAPMVDRLRLMVYDWSVDAPGPIAPMSWVNQVIAYSSPLVPASKLQLGVPAYGRRWGTQKNANEVCPDGALSKSSVEMKDAAALAAAHGAAPVRDPAGSGELTFSWTEKVTGPRTKPLIAPVLPPWLITVSKVNAPSAGNPLQPALRLAPPSATVTCTVVHTAFVPDAISVRQRADAAVAAGWSGIVIWALGFEPLNVYQSLAGIAPQRPDGAPSGSLAAPTVVGGSVRVTGQALHPEFDLPVPVRLTVTKTVGGSTVVHTVLARTQVTGMPLGVGRFHGIDDTFTLLAPGSYTVCGEVLRWGGATAAATNCQPFVVAGV